MRLITHEFMIIWKLFCLHPQDNRAVSLRNETQIKIQSLLK